MKARIRIIQGGTSASKTVSIILILIAMAQSDKKKTLTSIVSESFPHLRRGAERDFLNIMKEHQYFKDNRWDRTNHIYTFETGSQIEFFSVDQSEKVRGARRDRLFINEVNNVKLMAFEELEVRTKELIYLDYNPTNEFWLFTEIIPNRTDTEKIILTYLDNEALSKEIVDSIEQRKNRKDWWKVYGMGLLGVIQGRIYKDWKIIDEIAHEAKLVRRGMDFGYSNDPTTIVDIYEYNGGIILDEIVYRKGLSNKQIVDYIQAQKEDDVLVVADSAEPKSIDEIKSYDIPIVPFSKGKDSVRNGIQFIQEKKISVTKRSINIIREYRNYLWETDKDGAYITPPIPEHEFSHSMDAIRYGLAYNVSYEEPTLELWLQKRPKKVLNPAR